MNTRGLRSGKIIQNTFTFTKTAALIGLIVVGIVHAKNPLAAAWSSSWWDRPANGWSLESGRRRPGSTALPVVGVLGFLILFGKAMVGPLFSQTGWNGVTFTGGEIRDPGKRPAPRPADRLRDRGRRSTCWRTRAYVLTLSLAEIQDAENDRVGTATDAGDLPRASAAKLMAAGIMVSTFGCVNGLVLSGARVILRDGPGRRLLPPGRARTTPTTSPAFSLVMQGLWASILVLPLTVKDSTRRRPGSYRYGNLYNQLLDYIVPVDLLFYALMVGSVIVFRIRRPDADRPYRAFGYPITPHPLHRPGHAARGELHLPLPQGLGDRLPDRPERAARLPGLVAIRRKAAAETLD